MKRLAIVAVIIIAIGIFVFLAPYIGYCLFMVSNNARVDFYGRILDQNSNPIDGARVMVQIHATPTLLTPEINTINLLSDTNGCFSVKRQTGTILSVYSIDKSGYEVSGRETRNFNYGHHYGTSHVSDPKNPDLFRVWKKGVTEPLIKNYLNFPVMERTDCSVDLTTGKSSNNTNYNSDLWINVSSDGKGWKGNSTLCLTVPSGGLIETSERYLYLAPEKGYQNKIEWTFGSRTAKKLYLTSRNGGIYCALEIEATNHDDGKWRIVMNNTVNPNGSRNLEYDASKRIQAKR